MIIFRSMLDKNYDKIKFIEFAISTPYRISFQNGLV